MTTTTVAKKNVQKLQRAIVDGLEDVKAQDVKVFDTEKLSPLFERVIVASGTSNRQTKALAASVRDAVREAGFAKPRVEGEGNGEWIIVDCGAAVVHIMQPSFRQYYNLEELWGEKPVRLKLGAEKPVTKEAEAATGKAKGVKATKTDDKPTSLRRSSAAKKGVTEAFPSKAQEKAAAAKQAKAADKSGTAKKVSAKTVAVKKTAVAGSGEGVSQPAVGRAPVRSAVATTRKVVVKAPRKTPAKKAVAKGAEKNTAAKKTVAKKATVKNTTATKS